MNEDFFFFYKDIIHREMVLFLEKDYKRSKYSCQHYNQIGVVGYARYGGRS